MATSYGSITIVDIGDLGDLTVTPESNQPTMVVYNPDDNSYTPNWGGNPNLLITPVVYYGTTKLLDSSVATLPSTLTITWKYKFGNSDPTTINPTNPPANHTITSNGSLQVSANQLSVSNSILTYIVEVSYVDTALGLDANHPLQASGQITYGLIQNSTTLRMITVSGAGAFLYNSTNVCQNSPILLTATPTGVTVAGWQYKSGNSWVDIANSASNTLSVNESTSNYFNADVAVFRAVNDILNPTVYDEHSIVKIRDGAAGTSIDSAVLSNEDQMVPCDKGGNPITGAFNECTTTLTIYEGNTATYTGWSIAVDQTHGVTGTWNSTTHTFTATDISENTGYVTFTCTKTDHNTLTKTFSLVKVKAGADGTDGTSPTIYSLQVDALAVNKTNTGNTETLTPAKIHFNAYSQTGNGAKTPYSGKFKVYLDESTTSTTYPSNGTNSTYEYTIPTSIAKSIKVELYDSAGTTKLDTQTIVITQDGQKGDQGNGGLNFVVGNYSDQIPCNTNGIVIGSANIVKDITFSAYQGINPIYCTATINSGTVTNKITSSITQNTKIALTFVKNTDLGGTNQGTISFTLNAYPDSSHTTNNDLLGSQVFTYTWVKNTQGIDGKSAVAFQVYTPNGYTITSDSDTVTVSPLLIEGATDITTTVAASNYRWYKYQNGGYVEITSTTSTDPIYKSGRNLIVTGAAVDSYLSIKGTVSYTPTGETSAITYAAYHAIYDKIDIYQITVISTLGDKLVNSQGTGIIYTKVTKNGEPFDEIVSTAISTGNTATDFNNAVTETGVTGSDPTNYCWYLTSSSIALYKKTGTSWSAVTAANDPHEASYSWTGLHIADGSAAPLITWGSSKNKAILLNGSIVNKKTMFNVTMTV